MHVTALVNPASGDGEGEDLGAEFAARVGGADVRATTGPDDVGRLACDLTDTDPDVLAIVGGDGTVREVVDALGDEAPPLFVVPAGRGNSTYRHLYGTADWSALAERLRQGVAVHDADAGRVESDAFTGRFVLGYSAGLFRRTVEGSEAFDALPGPLAYVLGTARAVVGSDPLPVTATADGERVFDDRAHLVAVGGGRYRGNAFDLMPESRPGDGSLHLLVVEPAGALDAVATARAALSGDHVDRPGVHYHRASEVTLESSEGLPAEVDGTTLPSCPRADLRVLPGALPVAYPADR